MDVLPFGKLSPYRARRFVPAGADLGDWTHVAPMFDELELRLSSCGSAAELEKWLLDWSELNAALDEEASRRYIAMTCQTDNPQVEAAYLHFVEKIEPQLKPRQVTLAKAFLEHPERQSLPAERYEVFNRDAQVLVELFRQENVPLETEEAKLGQQYQKLSGSLTVDFEGKEQTLVQMGRYLEEPDRSLRQRAWEKVAARRLAEKERFDQLFDQMLELRRQIAKNAGFDSYVDYAFRARHRFDYGPEDCIRFHEAIEQEVMPVLRALQAERRQLLGVSTLRPWDLACDPRNRPPLRPFEKVEELLDLAQSVFDRLDPRLGKGFAVLRERRLLDLANRKGKAPGGYQSSLSEARLPFIFMNAVGLHRDVETLLHEAGHAFHVLATQQEDLYHYRHAPIEFCEVASMGMELLAGEHLDAFYGPEELRRARRKHLEGIVQVFPWIATVDAFQHWIYTHPNHTTEERAAAWSALMDRFDGDVDWSGHEDARAHLWHRQLHIFLHPFYYVEYGIAQLGALQLWANYRRDPAAALAAYQRALSLGGSRKLPELFAAAGLKFDFSAKTLAPLMNLVAGELERLSV